MRNFAPSSALGSVAVHQMAARKQFYVGLSPLEEGAKLKCSTMQFGRSGEPIYMTLVSIALFLSAIPSAQAGMRADLEKCAKAQSVDAAEACTRVLKSGRLPTRQRYIGYFNRGWAYRNNGQFRKALQDFNRAISLNSGHADSYYSRSVVHYDLGDPRQSLKDLDHYHSRHKRKTIAQYKRGLMLRRLNETERAITELERAARMSPEYDKIKILLAILRSDQGDHQAALAILNEIIKRNPKNANAYYARSLVLFRLDRLTGAKEAALEALRLKKNYLAALNILGLVAKKRNRIDIAKSHFGQAAKKQADSVESLYARKEARDHLSGLETSHKSKPKLSRVVDHQAPKSCRRFIPSAAITVAVPCPE